MKASNRRRWSFLVALAMVLMMLPTTAMAANYVDQTITLQTGKSDQGTTKITKEDGTSVSDGTTLPGGTVLRIYVKPNDGYLFDQAGYFDSIDSKWVSLNFTKDSNGDYVTTWTVPNYTTDRNLLIWADYVAKLKVTVNAYTDNNAKVTLSQNTASVGDEVTVTVVPNAGYKIHAVYYNDGTDKEVSADANGNYVIKVTENNDISVWAVCAYDDATITVESPIQNGKVVILDIDSSAPSNPLSSTARVGTQVRLQITPSNGYVLDKLTVKEAVSGKIIATEIGTNQSNHKFIMPGKDVFVTATFKLIEGPAPETYEVKVNSSTNGTVTADPSPAAAGGKVTLTVTPDKGYVLDKMTVKKTDGTEITVTNNSFTMPDENVVVTATFKVDTSKDGWNSDSVGIFYLENNQRVKGFQVIDDYKRYFDPTTGYMATGFKVINNNWYAFNEYGGMLYGWQVINGSVYYLGEEDGQYPGAVRFGVTNVDGFWRYFDNEGKLVYGGNYYVPQLGATYSINAYGALEYPVN